MLDQDESKGFEWLDTPFILTRIGITVIGMVCVLCSAVAAWQCLPSLPSPQAAGPGSVIGFVLVSLFISAMVLVWRRPRAAFLLAAAAWTPIGAYGSVRALIDPEGPQWLLMMMLLLPVGWLGFAAWKVGPRKNEQGRSPSRP